MISAAVGKSGPLMCFVSWASVASGLSRSSRQALTTSRALCDGMSVAMPTAMPDAPLRRTCGRRDGRRRGSLSVPSKFGPHSTVPCSSSERSVCEKRASFASV